MNIDIYLSKIEYEHQRAINEAISSFNSVQSCYRLRFRGKMTRCPWRQSINWAAARRVLTAPLNAPCRIVVTDSTFQDNWFAHCESGVCIVSTNQWFKLFAPPCLQSYLLLEFCLAAACFSAGVRDLDLKPHYDSVGCVADMCEEKLDLLLKLRAGYLCGEHEAILRQYNVTPQQLSAIMKIIELVRAFALGLEDQKQRLGAIRSGRIFLVHGRDTTARDSLISMLECLGLEPVVIMNEPTHGRTVIEQIEACADVGFALILFTPDDHGSRIGSRQLLPRPRQNVVFEYGLFVGWLGRRHVCCVAPDADIELPSDLGGVLQLRYKRSVNELQARIHQELEAAGYLLDPQAKNTLNGRRPGQKAPR